MRRLPFILSFSLLVSSASAEIYQWNGAASSAWITPANWNETGAPAGITKGPGPTTGNFKHRLNVNNGGANTLVYSPSLGITLYGGTGIRGLVIGSGSVGSMRITGGTFETTNSSIQDVITSPGIASESSLQIDGGSYRSKHLLLGLNNPSRNTLSISQGVAIIDTLDFNVQNGISTINLDGGILETKGFRISTTTPAASTNTFNFNGGVLKAGASSTLFFPNLARTAAQVKSGGARIDTNGFDITIFEPLTDGGGGGLIKSGSGILTLASPATFTGSTHVNDGTLVLGEGASLASTSGVILSSGAVLSVSATPNHVWPTGVPLTSSGGVLAGGLSVDLGAAALELNLIPPASGGGTVPGLSVQSGSFSHSGLLVVNNQTGAPLGVGNHVLVSHVGGAITGTPIFGGTVGGQGIQPGTFCELEIEGGNLVLAVRAPFVTTISLTRLPGSPTNSVYGDVLMFSVAINPPSASGTVELYHGGTGGTLIGRATLSGGSAVIKPARNALLPGAYPDIVAFYTGSASHLASTSSALSPAQSVSARVLTLSGAVAHDKYFDTTTAASLSATLTGVLDGDAVNVVLQGVFSEIGPGTAIPVTANITLTGPDAPKYSITPPAALSASIIAANVWTGGVGGGGTSLGTGSNFSPAATTTSPFNAIFNGLDPITTDLSLNGAVGGAVGTSGMVFGFAGNQINPVTITGSTGASARIASIIVAPGAGAVTFQGVLPFILGGPSVDTSHSFTNNSANPLVFQNTGNWIPGGSGSQLRSMLFGGVGDITVASSIVPSVPSRMSLAKSGSGILKLSGANTFSGGTTISEGKVIASTSNALGAGAVVNHGTLNLTAGAVNYTGLSSALSGNGVVNVTLGNGTAITPLNGNYSNFTGIWNLGIGATPGAGKVQMNGLDHPSATIEVIENATLYTTSGTHHASLVLHGGNTGESLGQLRIEGGATWAGEITLAGPITGPGDGHIGAASGTGTISGSIGEVGGAHSFVKDGDGTIILTGNSTYTGHTHVNDGILLVNSPGSTAPASSVNVASGATLGGSGLIGGSLTVAAGGTLDPGRAAPATLTVAGPFSLAGTTLIRVNRLSLATCSRIVSPGPIAFGGTLRVLNDGPTLKSGDAFQLFSAPSFSGSFATLLLPPLGYNLMWDTGDLAVGGTLRVISAASQDHPVITLTPGTFYQQMHGIGGNFCQGEQNVLLAYNRFDEMFGPEGLNMSFIRISTAHELAEPGFASFDANNVTTVQEFRARQPNGRVMLTTWTPPESLKSNGSPYQGTLAKTAGGQYRYADYGAWWTRVLQFYQNHAVLPDYVSIQNECDFTPTPPSSGNIPAYLAGCYLNSSETTTKAGYPQALAAVRSAFSAAGLGSMKMIGPDTTAIAGDKVKSYMDNIPSGQIHAIAHHLYHDSPGSTGIADLSRLQALYPNWAMPKFMTELNPHDTYEDWDSTQPGWMQLAVTMHNVFTYERANTYMVWSSMYGFIDRFTGKPNNANYYALAHFSRFVNANNWRVAASSNDPDVAVTHYRHYGGPGISDRQVIVMINKSADVKHTTVGAAASWSATPAQRSWQVHQTANDGSVSKRLAMTEIDQGPWLSGDRQLVLPPFSITTALVNTGTAASEFSNRQVWRFRNFGTMENSGNAADDVDSNDDGEINLYEFATGQDPFETTRVSPMLIQNGANLEFTYTRSKAAVLDGVTFAVEWSESLAPGSWSTAGIPDQEPMPLAETATGETLRILIPAGSARRFVRLEVVQP